MNSKTKKQAPKLNKKPIIIVAIAVVLLAAIILGATLILNYIFVDTPYDSIHLPDHIAIHKYLGVELSASEVESKLNEAKDGVLDLFTKKPAIEKGDKIEKGWNVTVSIIAKKGDKNSENIDAASYLGYEIADIGRHQAADNQDFFDKLQKHIIDNCTKFDHSLNSTYDNMLPSFSYTYPDALDWLNG